MHSWIQPEVAALFRAAIWELFTPTRLKQGTWHSLCTEQDGPWTKTQSLQPGEVQSSWHLIHEASLRGNQKPNEFQPDTGAPVSSAFYKDISVWMCTCGTHVLHIVPPMLAAAWLKPGQNSCTWCRAAVCSWFRFTPSRECQQGGVGLPGELGDAQVCASWEGSSQLPGVSAAQ